MDSAARQSQKVKRALRIMVEQSIALGRTNSEIMGEYSVTYAYVHDLRTHLDEDRQFYLNGVMS